jgi:hypothetical protein
VDMDMQDKHDTNLCLILYKKDLYFDPVDYLSCITLEETKKDFLIIQDKAVLRFKVNKNYPGGEVKFEMGFRYAIDSKAAKKEKNHLDFLFSQPEKLATTYAIDASMIEQEVLFPDLSIASLVLDDPNENNMLDAGEKMDAFFIIKNSGEGSGKNIRLKVFSTAKESHISYQQTTFVGDVLGGKSDTAKVSFMAPVNMEESTIPFYACLQEEGGNKADTFFFSIQTKALSNVPMLKWFEPLTSFFVTNSESVLVSLGIKSAEKITAAKLLINNKELDVISSVQASDGEYNYMLEYNVPLTEGLNTLKVRAKNEAGTSTSDEITIKFESLKGKRLALIIGNAAYEHVGVLANPLNDAQDMKEALEKVGFDVILSENASQKDIKLAIDDFGYELKEKNYEVALFFYAGHGLQYNNNNYLIPVNAVLGSEADIEYDCVAIGRVIGKMKEAEVQTTIIILDACRNNPFEKKWDKSSGSKGLAYMDAPTNTMISYSTAPGKVAMDGEGKNGLYTSILLQQILIPNQHIEQVFKNVRKAVEAKSSGTQTPWEVTSLKGDFYFFR